MRIGFTVFSANNDVDPAVKAKAPAPESLMNRRRVVFTQPTFSLFRVKSQSQGGANFELHQASKNFCKIIKKPVAPAVILLDMSRSLCQKLVPSPPVWPRSAV
jgi:hypothetical protein